jgi:hypothetical protein
MVMFCMGALVFGGGFTGLRKAVDKAAQKSDSEGQAKSASAKS